MNVAGFVLWYPEFAQTDATRIQAALNRAAVRMGGPDGQIWGTPAAPGNPPNQADEAQAAYAGALLMGSPFGFETRLKPGNGTNKYENEYLVLRDARVSPGVVVSGGCSMGGIPGPWGWPW